uniref:BZIP domain-containing protein n=1 Tax=Caenorhabditis tropicalis TaxID=1561998 RepID=A0A1I7UY38_9PELO
MPNNTPFGLLPSMQNTYQIIKNGFKPTKEWFQKFQKSIQLRIDNKKSAMRREQTAKIELKTQEFNGQLVKLAAFEENNRKKLEETERENEKLRSLIELFELDVGNIPRHLERDDDDFFIRNSPISSSPSVAGSVTDNEEMLEFDLLGLKNRSDSSSSNCSSQSNRPGSLF